MEEIQKEAETKKLKRTEQLQNLELKCTLANGEKQSISETLSLWKRILARIVTADESHGSNKPPETSWISFFENVIGGPVPSSPHFFNDAEPALEDVIVLLSSHMLSLRKELEKHERVLENAQKQLEARKTSMTRRDDRAKRKLEKAWEIKVAGKEEEVAESKRLIGEWAEFLGGEGSGKG